MYSRWSVMALLLVRLLITYRLHTLSSRIFRRILNILKQMKTNFYRVLKFPWEGQGKDEWEDEEAETFWKKERESTHLKHFFMRNRLEVVINSNYHCSKLCWGRCRIETGKSNYGHPGLKIKKTTASNYLLRTFCACVWVPETLECCLQDSRFLLMTTYSQYLKLNL